MKKKITGWILISIPLIAIFIYSAIDIGVWETATFLVIIVVITGCFLFGASLIFEEEDDS